jgi:hypothetical protein
MSLRIRLKSIKCVREINELSASEEPYILLTSVRLERTSVGTDTHNMRVFRYGVWEDFDAGEVQNVFDPPFWGLNSTPQELTNISDVIFIVTLMENDNGDPNGYRQFVEAAASGSLGATLGERERSVRASRLLQSIRDALNGIDMPIPFALDDDYIGTEILRLDNSDLILSGSRDKLLSIASNEGDYELNFEVARIHVAANPQDKRVLVMGNRIMVNTNDGGVFVHDITGNTIGAPFQLSGPPVAANPQDKWVLVMGNRILVIVNEGKVFAHDITGNTISTPFQLS